MALIFDTITLPRILIRSLLLSTPYCSMHLFPRSRVDTFLTLGSGLNSQMFKFYEPFSSIYILEFTSFSRVESFPLFGGVLVSSFLRSPLTAAGARGN